MSKRVVLKDIANKVGVSAALVSYVLNEKYTGRINKTVAQKIRDTARELNYRTNQIARSLKTSRTNTIGLIVADISNPFSANMARIIEDEAARKNFTVIFGSSDENPLKSERLVDTFLTRHVDGLIIAPRENTEYLVHNLLQQETPFVLVDRYFPALDTNYIAMDNFKAAFDAVTFLLTRGYRQIGMINYRTSLHNIRERSAGYKAALETSVPVVAGGRLKEVNNDELQQQVEQALGELLQGDNPIDAILFASNEIALHGVKYIKKLQIKVPAELALISFDEVAAWDLFYAPLTYIRQPLHEMGQLATRILLESIYDNSKTQQYKIPGELVVREST